MSTVSKNYSDNQPTFKQNSQNSFNPSGSHIQQQTVQKLKNYGVNQSIATTAKGYNSVINTEDKASLKGSLIQNQSIYNSPYAPIVFPSPFVHDQIIIDNTVLNLRARLAENETRNKHLCAENARLHDDILFWQNKLQSIEDQKFAIINQSKLQTQDQIHNSQISVNINLEQLTNEIHQLQLAIQEQDNVLSQNLTDISNRQTILSQQKHEIMNKDVLLNKNKRMLQNNSDVLNTKLNEVESLKITNSNLLNQEAQLEKENVVLNETLNKLQQQYDDHQNQFERQRANNSRDLLFQQQTFEHNSNDLKNQHITNLTNLQAQIEDAQKQVHCQNNELENLRRHNNQLRNNLELTQTQIQNSSNEVEVWKQRVSVAELNRQKEIQQAQNLKNSQLEDMQQQYNADLANLQNKLNQLNNQLANTEQDLKNITSNLNNTQDVNNNLQVEKKSLEQQINDSKTQQHLQNQQQLNQLNDIANQNLKELQTLQVQQNLEKNNLLQNLANLENQVQCKTRDLSASRQNLHQQNLRLRNLHDVQKSASLERDYYRNLSDSLEKKKNFDIQSKIQENARIVKHLDQNQQAELAVQEQQKANLANIYNSRIAENLKLKSQENELHNSLNNSIIQNDLKTNENQTLDKLLYKEREEGVIQQSQLQNNRLAEVNELKRSLDLQQSIQNNQIHNYNSQIQDGNYSLNRIQEVNNKTQNQYLQNQISASYYQKAASNEAIKRVNIYIRYKQLERSQQEQLNCQTLSGIHNGLIAQQAFQINDLNQKQQVLSYANAQRNHVNFIPRPY